MARKNKNSGRGFALHSNRIIYNKREHANKVLEILRAIRMDVGPNIKIPCYMRRPDDTFTVTTAQRICNGFNTRFDATNITSFNNLIQHFRATDEQFKEELDGIIEPTDFMLQMREIRAHRDQAEVESIASSIDNYSYHQPDEWNDNNDDNDIIYFDRYQQNVIAVDDWDAPPTDSMEAAGRTMDNLELIENPPISKEQFLALPPRRRILVQQTTSQLDRNYQQYLHRLRVSAKDLFDGGVLIKNRMVEIIEEKDIRDRRIAHHSLVPQEWIDQQVQNRRTELINIIDSLIAAGKKAKEERPAARIIAAPKRPADDLGCTCNDCKAATEENRIPFYKRACKQRID